MAPPEKANVFIGYDPAIIGGPTPFDNRSIAEVFCTRLRALAASPCANLSFVVDSEHTGWSLDDSRNAIENSVAFIGLVANGHISNNTRLAEWLEIFCEKPAFSFDSPPWHRIFLVAVDPRPQPTSGKPTFKFHGRGAEYALKTGSLEDFDESIEVLVNKFQRDLADLYHPKGRIVLGIPVPGDTKNFREDIRQEILYHAELGYEVVDANQFDDKKTAYPHDEMHRRLTKAVEGADAMLHFVAKGLDASFAVKNSFKRVLDVQFEVADAAGNGLRQIFCAGPEYESPHETSSEYQGKIANTIPFKDVEDFLKHLIYKLNSVPIAVPQNEREITICLIGESGDKEALEEIEKYLRSENYKVKQLTGSKELDQTRFLLFYWGIASDAWYPNKLRQVVSAKKRSSKKTVEVAGVYFAQEDTAIKLEASQANDVPTGAKNIILKYEPLRAWDRFQPRHLQRFLEAVKASAGD